MGKFKAVDADNYGNNTDVGYLSLKNDKDKAVVRFCYNTVDDAEGYAVHEVKVGNTRKYINCLRDYTQPLSDCPFCQSGMQQKVKVFVPVFDLSDNSMKVWERGKQIFGQISELCSKYANNGTPFVSNIFTIERQGAKGAIDTVYNISFNNADNMTLANLPDLPQPEGKYVINKTFDEMNFYLQNGYFESDGPNEDFGIRRRNEFSDRSFRDIPTGNVSDNRSLSYTQQQSMRPVPTQQTVQDRRRDVY